MAGSHVKRSAFWMGQVCALSCLKCEDFYEGSPSCTLAADSLGRFHFNFSSRCSAAIAMEASFCAHVAPSLPEAFLFMDVALKHVASFGGTTCFDDFWGQGSSDRLLKASLDVLQGLGAPSHRKHSCEGRRPKINFSNGNLPLITCLVPIVWPCQEAFLHAIHDTFGQDCDELRFFVSASSIEGDLKRLPRTVSLVNLREDYPVVPPDDDAFHRETGHRPQHDSFNTIIKLLHMLRWEAERANESEQHWFCRLERDTFFLPENFRLLVVNEGLDASEAHYLGAREFFDLPRTGLVFNDGGPGICLSRRALLDLLPILRRLKYVEQPDFETCALATGHREDLMLAVCLREAQIFPSAVTTDVSGREWFSIRPLFGIPSHRPPIQHPRFDGTRHQEAWNFWTGRSHLYLPCIHHNIFWVVETPISFNSFKSVSMFYETWSLLKLPAAERFAKLGFPLELSGLQKQRLDR